MKENFLYYSQFKTKSLMAKTKLIIERVYDLPEKPDQNTVYVLLPKEFSTDYYHERIDRNIGWITREDQKKLHTAVVGIAGCGGMGGLVAATMIRLGVGEIRIADSETFDISNVNRQFGATKGTVGVSKAFATARMLRAICDDTQLVVYPQGITEETVGDFMDGCNVVCDEVEFWAAGSRILLHREARLREVTILNCNSVGFGTFGFRFAPGAVRLEEKLGFEYDRARELQEKIQARSAEESEISEVQEAVLRVFVPVGLPEYSSNMGAYSTRDVAHNRLFREGRAPIIATNPAMASGFLGNHVLFHLLRDSETQKNFAEIPLFPGYVWLDAALGTYKTIVS